MDNSLLVNMSTTRSYSKESRSYYSRSSSSSNNDRSNFSYRNRPLSSRLIKRDLSPPSSTFDYFDEPYCFERRSRRFIDDFDRRLRWRFHDDFFDEEFFKSSFEDTPSGFERNIPINYRAYNSSSSITRDVPVQYIPSSTYRREKIDTNTDLGSNSLERNRECFESMSNFFYQ